jgi:outer membrane usher protein
MRAPHLTLRRIDLTALALFAALPLLAAPPARAAPDDAGIPVLAATATAANAASAAAATADEWREAVLDVSINSQPVTEVLVLLRDRAGGFWIEERDAARLRLQTAGQRLRTINGKAWLALSALPGIVLTLDEGRQRLDVTAPAGAFVPERVSLAPRATPMPGTASPGAFLNYQLSARRVGSTDTSGGFAELGAFAARGVVTSSSLLRSDPLGTRGLRLESTYTADFPERMERLTIGDAISDGDSWGSAVRFAGIGWGRDFSLRPDLVTTPLLSVAGNATVPSTVDVYVNRQRVSTQAVQPGSFIIDRLPVVTGSGNVSLVVRDALGREQVYTQPFYSSIRLLAAGLSQYGVSLGAIRRDYALESNAYGAMMGAASWRRGITSGLTVEAHAEYLANAAHAAGLGVAVALGRAGVANLALASGGDASGSGTLATLGFERQGARFNFALASSLASSGYRQIASSEQGALRTRRRDLLQFGASLGRAGSVAVALVHQKFDDARSEQTGSLSWSRVLGERGAINLSASRNVFEGSASTSFFLTFALAMDQRSSLAVAMNGGAGEGAPPNEIYTSYSTNPPVGPGSGYRVAASTTGAYDLEWRRQQAVGDLALEAVRNGGVSAASVDWSGAASLLDGEVHALRRIDGSFAMVDVAGLAEVPVYVDNQFVARTDRNGRALIQGLRAYEANRISIDPVELPLETRIDSRTLVLAPAFRSGVVARFAVEQTHGATFRLVTPEGAPLAVGSTATFAGQSFPVTFDGVTYVTGVDRVTAGEAQDGTRRCRFEVELPPGNDPLPDLGAVVCTPIEAP